MEAVAFLNAEIQAGTDAIITTLYNQQVLPSLWAANAAGIPVYIIGGASPDLLADVQDREPPTGPLRASLRYVGPDVDEGIHRLARRLMGAGITHVECIITEVGSALHAHRCQVLVETFQAAGLLGAWHLRAALSFDLMAYLQMLETLDEGIPGDELALVVMDSFVYSSIKGPLRQGSKANATLVVYETSVGAMQDMRDGYNVVAVDPGFYTQGYLGLALAGAELQTGQMIMSDIAIKPTIYGGENKGFSPVTDAILQREVCRAEGNPVCGDPGVAPVSPSGCRCFDRRDVRYKVVSGLPKRLSFVHLLWQGVKDAERDMPGSTFDWKVYDDTTFFDMQEYAEVTNSTKYRGAISLDTLGSDAQPELQAAIRSIAQAGKPLYLAFGKADPPRMQDFLDAYGARSYVGSIPFVSGLEISQFASQVGFRHMLANNVASIVPQGWKLMHGLVVGVVGQGYDFPPGIWEWPISDHGNPDNRTGAYALFVAPGSNRTVQVMDGFVPILGDAFVAPLSARLTTDVPAPDMVVMDVYDDLIATSLLKLLDQLAQRRGAQGGQGDGPPVVRAILQKCTPTEYLALARQGHLQGERLLMGCIDEQAYISTYLTATLAALEQQTGERVGGGVDTARLLKAMELPRNFMRRMKCQMDGYNRGVMKGKLGTFFPVCDARSGCVPEGLAAPRDAQVCSGRGTCQFPTEANSSDATDPTQGTCRCVPGWQGRYCQVPVTAAAASKNDGSSPALLIALVTAGVAVGLLAAAAGFYYVRRAKQQQGDAKELQEFLRKRTPPGRGECIATVVTDIEGSTSLWEWNPAVMNQALVIHHIVLRSLLPKYYGYESDTEGDSFTLVFHDAVDALGWAMEVQRQLLYPGPILQMYGTMLPSASVQHQLGGKKNNAGGGTHLTDWPAELLGTKACKEVKDAVDGSVLYRGLRVRMGIHIGFPESTIMHPNGRQHYHGEVVELAKAIQGAAASGGQVLMSMLAWHSLGLDMHLVICHHMGMHEVAPQLPPVHLMQVLPHELVRRVPFLPLKSTQLWPSFFDAPCASECYLKAEPPRQPVVICFMYVGSASILRRTPGYAQAIRLLVGFVESLLSRYEAYECEEKDGNFLLAFRSPIMAAQFAEAVQRKAMQLDWPEKLLEQESAAEVVKLAGEGSGRLTKVECVVFRGLRLQIGLCMGVPNDCQPHGTTGRAAYFGPVVNRAARIAATAAPGQTLANHGMYDMTRGASQKIAFQELGEFGLKGVKEPLRLYQISSDALRHRLFARTLKLAKSPIPGIGLDECTPLSTRCQAGEGTAPLLPGSQSAVFFPVTHLAGDNLAATGDATAPAAAESSNRRPFRRSFSGRPRGLALEVVPELDDDELAKSSFDELVARVKRLQAENRVLRACQPGLHQRGL
eukprot:jgi/Mesvir1/27533/Mv07292-RA.2